MKGTLLFFLIGFLIINESTAQFTRYVVKFKNKAATNFTLVDPSDYLSGRAIDRRTRYNIAIDSTDLPVPASYISQVKNIPGVTVLNISKWLNAVSIDISGPDALAELNALPFVQSTSPVAAKTRIGNVNKSATENLTSALVTSMAKSSGMTADYFNYGTGSFNEIHLHKGEFLHNIGLRGQGMQIAMLDGGFFNYTTLDAMDSIIANGQVLSTWDFVNNEASVVEDNSHGMQCLSTIAANIPGQFIGKAPKASFHLYKTEDVPTEYPIEEFNWACGAERADSSGADILSSSVGYGSDFSGGIADYPYSSLDGNTNMSTMAADLAAKKGLVVFISAGNTGNSPFHYLISPSDGDSVIAVSAVNTSGLVGAFSAYGPSFDGRIKPDIASVGVAAMVQGPNNAIGINNGTSFACPNMAGLATCLWQGFPEFDNMRIIRALKEAGSIFYAPDDRIGYGIPDMKSAFSSLLIEYASLDAVLDSCTATLNWNSKDVSFMKYEIEKKSLADTRYIKIAEVNAAGGNILANHSYQFSNSLTGMGAGITSYRIRQIIDTSTADFSAVFIDTASITLDSACKTIGPVDPAADKIIVQPSPTNSDATLIVETNLAIPDMPVTIYDMNGRLVMKLQASKGPGKVTIALPVNVLAKGKYIITVYDNSKTIGSANLLKL